MSAMNEQRINQIPGDSVSVRGPRFETESPKKTLFQSGVLFREENFIPEVSYVSFSDPSLMLVDRVYTVYAMSAPI